MVGTRVVNVARVSLSPAPDVTPEPIRLSLLDTLWVPLPPVKRLFLYRTDRPFPSLVEEIKRSLSRTLPRFYSLTGRFTHVPDSGDVVIGFSGDGHDGVDFLEAQAEGVDFQRLVDDQDHDVERFLSLVPPLDVRELPAPVFSVQVTGFAGGGVALGFSVHHMAVDGKAVWQFVEAWAAECRRGTAAGVPEPVLDRSVIRHPKGQEMARTFLRASAPNLPSLSNPNIEFLNGRGMARRTFVVSAASIAALKDRYTAATRPSAFVALSAHFWLTYLRAKDIPPDNKLTVLCFLADCRRHLDPPVGDNYFGNCVRPIIVKAKSSELLGAGEEAGFAAACVAIRRIIEERLREPLSDVEEWMGSLAGVPMERVANVAASPRFRVYEQADFGWGRPRRVELLSMNKEGEVALVAARDEEGDVQASVALSPPRMDTFATLFLAGLRHG